MRYRKFLAQSRKKPFNRLQKSAFVRFWELIWTKTFPVLSHNVLFKYQSNNVNIFDSKIISMCNLFSLSFLPFLPLARFHTKLQLSAWVNFGLNIAVFLVSKCKLLPLLLFNFSLLCCCLTGLLLLCEN